MKCPLCDSEAVVLKKQILEYSIITFYQCSDKPCSHKFVENTPTKAYPDKNLASLLKGNGEQKKQTKSFHFLDNRN